ncbi:CapA family protein [Oceanobacillus halotolerans]|uniref:CapA family protein n=1 Tax=Oceanobacillus halotolerans TaxID=2663380 RepID=UPI0013DBCAC5|nr:CapA family protein [Oceanobacillus halotolerans]
MVDNSRNFKIALTGDSIIARKFSAIGESTKELFQMIRDSDVAFTNLEVLPNDFKGYPAARSDGAHFAAHNWVLDDLLDLGFDLFSCANNHALDYSVEGLLETLEQLESRNMSYAGVGRSLTEARMPAYTDFTSGSVAMLSCTSTFFEEQSAGEQRSEVQGRPGINPLRYETIYEVTSDQFNLLETISRDLGIEQQRQEFINLGFASEEQDPKLLPLVDTNLRATSPLNAKFRIAENPEVRTQPNSKDLEEICQWVRESKARAQISVVSLHAHEQGDTREKPAEFIRTFAHRVIDAGADIVVGHGPHLLRGMEMYKGKPIFYSLGNFIGQNELIYKLPADSYRRFGIEETFTPSEVFRIRSDNGQKGFPGDDLYWQTVMPVCYFEDEQLTGIDIVPVGLSHGNKPYKRGTPYLAKSIDAEKIIGDFSNLSIEFGTHISYHDGFGYVK